MLNAQQNQAFVDLLGDLASQKKATPVQIALALGIGSEVWMASIPGTITLSRVEREPRGSLYRIDTIRHG